MSGDELEPYWRIQTPYGMVFAKDDGTEAVMVSTMIRAGLPEDTWNRVCGEDVAGGPVVVDGTAYRFLGRFLRQDDGSWTPQSVNWSTRPRPRFVQGMDGMVPVRLALEDEKLLLEAVRSGLRDLADRPDVAAWMARLKLRTLREEVSLLEDQRRRELERVQATTLRIEGLIGRMEALAEIVAAGDGAV